MEVTMKHLHADTYGVWIKGHASCAQGQDRRVAFVRDVPKSDVLFVPQHKLAASEQAEVVKAVKAWHSSPDAIAKSFTNMEKKVVDGIAIEPAEETTDKETNRDSGQSGDPRPE